MRALVLLILQLYLTEGFLPRPPQVYLPADDGDDPGLPLILTPYIERGEIELARNLSQVELPGISLDKPSHAGFLTVNATYNSNLFFWYVPDQISGPFSQDVVVVWLQGGPGASSLYGLFEENGPFEVKYTNETFSFASRKWQWSKGYTLLYIDNPVGAGFSFTEDIRGFCKNQTQVGEQLYSALIQFSQLFPELKNYKYVIAGESYAGKYIPALGHTIHEKNPSAEIKINLHGMLILNGWCDPINQLVYHKHGHQLGFYNELNALQIKTMVWKTSYYIKKNHWLKAAGVNQIMFSYMKNAIKLGHDVGFDGNFNMYNILNDHEDLHYFLGYINTNTIRKAIHVGNAQYKPFSHTVYQHLKPDLHKSVTPWISELLEHYIVAFYTGQLDLVVPYASTVNFLRKLDFNGSELYKVAERYNNFLIKFRRDDDNNIIGPIFKPLGYNRRAGNLIEGVWVTAGHQIARDDKYSIMLLDDVTGFPVVYADPTYIID